MNLDKDCKWRKHKVPMLSLRKSRRNKSQQTQKPRLKTKKAQIVHEDVLELSNAFEDIKNKKEMKFRELHEHIEQLKQIEQEKNDIVQKNIQMESDLEILNSLH